MNKLTELLISAFCPHKHDNLLFLNTGIVGTNKGTEEIRYFYKCDKCGAELCLDKPIDCCGCTHLYTDEGGTHCDLDFKDKACISNNRECFNIDWTGIKPTEA